MIPYRVSSRLITFSRLMSSTNSSKLKGKVAVVTASTDGIGYAIAERLGLDGASIVVSSRKEAHVTKAVDQLKEKGITSVVGTTCHVSKGSDRIKLFNEAVKAFGGIDILVSNAAANPTVGSVYDCPEEVWDKIFDVNVKSAFMLSKEVIPFMDKRGGGSIVYVSSIAGFQPIDLLGAYSVSKTALLGLTKAGAADLAKNNIRVNCIAPGIVKTKFSSALHESEVAAEAMLAMIPMKRLAMPVEIAGTVSFLCSDDASYITGETIVISGGMSSRL